MALTTGTLESVYDGARGRAAEAREQLAPRVRRAQQVFVPAFVGAFTTARVKSAELIDSGAVTEARHRAADVVRAARGKPERVASRRTWPVAALWFAGGTAAGVAIAVVARRLATPIPEPFGDEYGDGQQLIEPGGHVRTEDANADISGELTPATP